LDYSAVHRARERLRPYGGLICFHVLLNRLATGTSKPQTGCGNHIDTKPLREIMPMKHAFTAGDHVEWNSEAGVVRGTIKKEVSSAITFKGYTVRASKEEPQYLIKSDTTDHLAMHKGSALKKLHSKQ